jgi:hypothetical protein
MQANYNPYYFSGLLKEKEKIKKNTNSNSARKPLLTGSDKKLYNTFKNEAYDGPTNLSSRNSISSSGSSSSSITKNDSLD